MRTDGPLIVAIDQGTGSTKVLVVDAHGAVVARGSAPLAQQQPQPGWAEHRPLDVLASVDAALADACSDIDTARIAAIGISNQRESLLAWDRASGAALTPVISWQDRRTTGLCAELAAAGHGDLVRQVSGLPLDPMFSAAKAAWIVRNVDTARACLGTIDAWLVRHLTGEFAIEAGNASRTSLVDLTTGSWSAELLDVFGIPEAVLPPIVASAGDFGRTRAGLPVPAGIPVTGVLGDSHAALFAHAGWHPGIAKATYGTGSSIMTLAGDGPQSTDGLCRTIAWQLPGHKPALALEGNILSSGSTLVWLAELLGTTPAALADEAAEDSGGVALVPAFSGLGAPWWDAQARAVLVGMTLGTTRPQLARAALDSIALQVSDVVADVRSAGALPSVLVADGNGAGNTSLMQLQADLCGVPVHASSVTELSALGAAHLAGLGIGLWTLADLAALPREYHRIEPRHQTATAPLRARWHDAVARARLTTTDPHAPNTERA